jgi:hypothetical protein
MEQKMLADTMNMSFQFNTLLIVATLKNMKMAVSKKLLNKTLTCGPVYGTEGDCRHDELEVSVQPVTDRDDI